LGLLVCGREQGKWLSNLLLLLVGNREQVVSPEHVECAGSVDQRPKVVAGEPFKF
jgi:hypothetical protein